MSFRPLKIALGLLTRLPLRPPPKEPPSEQMLGYSVLTYPVVGLILGTLLAGLALFPFPLTHDLHAALLLAFWVWITGGLHLDGLADSVDAWVGGMGHRERTLEIMQDSHSGPMAIITLTLLLLVKFAAIKAVLSTGDVAWLVLPPILGRSGILLLFLTTPYVRPQGMGAVAAQAVPKIIGALLLILMGGGLILLLGEPCATPLAACLCMFFLVRQALMQRIGGTTGDTTGAMCELLEIATLLSIQGIGAVGLVG